MMELIISGDVVIFWMLSHTFSTFTRHKKHEAENFTTENPPHLYYSVARLCIIIIIINKVIKNVTPFYSRIDFSGLKKNTLSLNIFLPVSVLLAAKTF